MVEPTRTYHITKGFPFHHFQSLQTLYLKPESDESCRIKFHFVPALLSSFEKIVSESFDEIDQHSYTEIFLDDQNFSNIKTSVWVKRTNKATKGFYSTRNEISLIRNDGTTITFKETKSKLLVDPHVPITDNEIEILVQRKRYLFKERSFPLHLTIDEAEFPNGELYTVFAIFLDIPQHLWPSYQKLIDNTNSSELCVPVRGKIIHYEIRVYESLVLLAARTCFKQRYSL